MSSPVPRRGRGRRPVDPQTGPGEVTAQIVTALGVGQAAALREVAERWATSMADVMRQVAAWGVRRPAALVRAQGPVAAAADGDDDRMFCWAPGALLTAALDTQAGEVSAPVSGRPDRAGLLRRHVAAFLTGAGGASFIAEAATDVGGLRQLIADIRVLIARPEFAGLFPRLEFDGPAEVRLAVDFARPATRAGDADRVAWARLVPHLRALVAAAEESGGVTVCLEVGMPYGDPPAPAAPAGPETWTSEECAAFWRVEPATWRYYARNGYAPEPLPGRYGGRRRWDADTVRNYRRPGTGARTDLPPVASDGT